MPSNNVTRKWRKIEEKRSADDKYTLGTHMRYVYAFSNITKYSESVGSPTRPSKLNLGCIKWPPSCIFHENLTLHLCNTPFSERVPTRHSACSYTQDHEIRVPARFSQRKVPYATRLVCNWLTIENQFSRIDNLNRSSQLLRVCVAWKVEKLPA